MIIAVEGPSAAGKTTWCAQQGLPVVPEYAPTDHEPDGTDDNVAGAYWTEVNVARWQEALALEQRHGLVLCDSDPLELHYSWCLTRVGAAPWSRFVHESRHVRAAFATGRLGLADVVLVSIPPVDVLRRRRDGDPTRRRSTFALHARLSDPLREWYAAIATVDPRRVIWELPSDGVPTSLGTRPTRSDVDVLDRVVDRLPRKAP